MRDSRASFGWRSGVALLGALALNAVAAAGQQAPSSLRPRVLMFTDTASVRIDVEVPAALVSPGALVHAEIRAPGERTSLWAGSLGTLVDSGDGIARLSRQITGLEPRRWSPQQPNLYHAVLHAGAWRDSVRFGFRSVEDRGGRIYLNGRPIFLRGNAINPPGRTLPDSLSENRRFAEDYIRELKRIGINAVRTSRESQLWFDVCDELGMMLVQGRYGPPPGWSGNRPGPGGARRAVQAYQEEVLKALVNHPSVVVYILSNELASEDIPIKREGAELVTAFMDSVYPALRAWDYTRLYIANAGYGMGRGGDIDDLHRYWGWYYNSFLSYLTLRQPELYWRSGRRQAFTITEAIGTYTGVDGRINLVSRSKQPDLQLQWTGHAPDSVQSALALGYQAFLAKQGIELTRRLRGQNPHLGGIMPFTILFHRWFEIGGVADMRPKPAAEQFRISYQPVLLSWELWTRQVYAGTTLRPIAHLVNDAEDGRTLRGAVLSYELRAAGGAVMLSGTRALAEVPYFGTARLPLVLSLPDTLATGEYELSGIVRQEGREVSRNTERVFVAQRSYGGSVPEGGRRLRLYDPAGVTARALAGARLAHERLQGFDALEPMSDLLVIGAGAGDSVLNRAGSSLRRFVERGGRVLLLSPDPARFDASWLPVPVTLRTAVMDHELIYPGGRPHRNGMSVNPERPQHPVFDGIARERLFLWSDPAGWDETRPGFPDLYPVAQGFTIDSIADSPRVAVLANYDLGLQGVALAELFAGRGSVLISGLSIIEHAGTDPVADRMLRNLIRYQGGEAGHEPLVLIDSKIEWGDYASERGLLTGIASGLLLHTVPLVPPALGDRYPLTVDSLGYHSVGAGWNTDPGIQHVARGRRPFGPYLFDLGGWVRLPPGHAAEGEGRVWLRVPAGRRELLTRVWNPAAAALELEVSVNGVGQRARIAAGETVLVRTAVTATELAIVYRGDRRLVLLETDFR